MRVDAVDFALERVVFLGLGGVERGAGLGRLSP
jgi:hypothetical protein